jgi:hypothetical protein
MSYEDIVDARPWLDVARRWFDGARRPVALFSAYFLGSAWLGGGMAVATMSRKKYN